LPCDIHFEEEKKVDLDEIEIDAWKWAICDLNEKSKKNIDYDQINEEDDEKIIINEDIKVIELAP